MGPSLRICPEVSTKVGGRPSTFNSPSPLLFWSSKRSIKEEAYNDEEGTVSTRDFAPFCELEAKTAKREADTVYIHKYM